MSKFEFEQSLDQINASLRKMEPLEIIQWAMNQADRPVLTTNFGPYSASLIHAVTRVHPNIKVIWCDTGYNTPHTYRHALDLINRFSLNMFIYTPRLTAGFRDITTGIPEVDTEAHQRFTDEVKLEPFRRAMNEHRPDVWLTNIRADQTAHRSKLDIIHFDSKGVLKVSPFFHYSEFDLELYLQRFALPNEKKYFDPTKVLEKRECGLHL